MRYRKQTADGDYAFGSSTVWLVNTPETVAQAVRTRMRLYAGEWFLDDREGLALDRVLGYGTQTTRDLEMQQRIFNTEGVNSIISYESRVDGRDFIVRTTIDTIYGQAEIEETL